MILRQAGETGRRRPGSIDLLRGRDLTPGPLVRTLILTSSTGGGHNMRASSFVHWTHETLGAGAAEEIQIHKCLENTHGLYRFGVGLYNRIQRHIPWAHHVYFNFL